MSFKLIAFVRNDRVFHKNQRQVEMEAVAQNMHDIVDEATSTAAASHIACTVEHELCIKIRNLKVHTRWLVAAIACACTKVCM